MGVGYVGSLLAYLVGVLLLPSRSTPTIDDYAAAFRGVAIVFLVFALPAFLFIRERRRLAPPMSLRDRPPGLCAAGGHGAPGPPLSSLGRFLVGRMFYADAANTLIFMIVLYATGALAMQRADAMTAAILSIVAAIPPASPGAGWWTASAPGGRWTASSSCGW